VAAFESSIARHQTTPFPEINPNIDERCRVRTIRRKSGKFAWLRYIFDGIWVTLTNHRESFSYGFILL
jgi:hypothetical protein